MSYEKVTPLMIENSNVFQHIAVAENQIFVVADKN